MAKVTFSKSALARIKPPLAGRTYVYDAATPGLLIQLTPSGARSFQLYWKRHGRPQRVTLGRYDPNIPDAVRLPEDIDADSVNVFLSTHPPINIAQARRLTAILRGRPDDARTPAAARRAAAGLPTVGAILDRYRALHLEPHRRPRSVANFDDARRNLSRFENIRIDRLTAEAVGRWHAELGARHAVSANRALEVIRAAVNWARRAGYLSATVPNPAAGVKPHKEKSRTRFVTRPELGAFLAALEATRQPWRDLLALALWTGQRIGAVRAARWAHIDLAGGTCWHLPAYAAKNGEPVTVPLVAPALEILARRREAADEGDTFVFPAGAKSKTGHAGSPKKVWADLVRRSGLADVRVHDLRRTIGSFMAAGNASLHVIGAALGHRSRESTTIYARLQNEPVRAALTIAADAIMGAAKPANKRA